MTCRKRTGLAPGGRASGGGAAGERRGAGGTACLLRTLLNPSLDGSAAAAHFSLRHVALKRPGP